MVVPSLEAKIDRLGETAFRIKSQRDSLIACLKRCPPDGDLAAMLRWRLEASALIASVETGS